jgi:hypothetical protein
MAKPRIFISSTFYDLKHVRSSLETFVVSLGYEPVLSEKGSIAYSPDVALDESCYREAKACDIFVLIVGGRYGSEVSASSTPDGKGFYELYESITRREYESASDRGILNLTGATPAIVLGGRCFMCGADRSLVVETIGQKRGPSLAPSAIAPHRLSRRNRVHGPEGRRGHLDRLATVFEDRLQRGGCGRLGHRGWGRGVDHGGACVGWPSSS